VRFEGGQITQLYSDDRGEFMISGPEEWWSAVFRARIDPFLATQQDKLKLKRGELAQLARWYKPFERAFRLANRIDSVGFSAVELLDQGEKEHPNKTAIIDRTEELNFSILTRGACSSSHLHSEGIKQAERVGVLYQTARQFR
jgi:hypothetical protein